MQRVRGLTQKHNSVSKRLHNLRAIAPRFWIVVALSSDASHIYTLRLGMPMLIYGETIAVRMRQTSFPQDLGSSGGRLGASRQRHG
jgi:hypothetical protein